MNSQTSVTPIRVLLLENDLRSGRLRAESIESEKYNNRPYSVQLAHDESQAARLIEASRFDFLLADLLLEPGTQGSLSNTITDGDVDNPANGSKVAMRLLHYHRETHRERPSDPRQLRTIIYSGADIARDADGDRVRVKILCDGAHDVISREPEEMRVVLRSLGDMCDLQEELTRLLDGTSWLSKIVQRLGCGISIIGRSWKIWYCSARNAVYTGLDPTQFHDRVCWHEYFGLSGLDMFCPECPSAIVMSRQTCGTRGRRDGTRGNEPYPFSAADRSRSDPDSMCDESCPGGLGLTSYTNCRLLPVRGTLRWVHMTASPIRSGDGERIIGAVETVLDMDEFYRAFYEREQLAGRVALKDMLAPAMAIAQWLGYGRSRVFRLSGDDKELIGLSGPQIGAGGGLEGYRCPASETIVRQLSSQGGAEDRVTDSRVDTGPGLLGREAPGQYMEFALLHPTTGSVVGVLVVDDLGTVPTRAYHENDLAKLRPVADYCARVLAVERDRQHSQSLERHAATLRFLESVCSDHLANRSAAPRKLLIEELRSVVVQHLQAVLPHEPGLVGFHVRFLFREDGCLHLFSGIGPYLRLASTTVAVDDHHSLSASAFRERKSHIVYDAVTHPPFVALRSRLLAAGSQDQELLKWCEEVRVLGCFPIVWGESVLGTLTVAAWTTDFFSTESLRFLEEVCLFIARTLGPPHQQLERDEFLENAGYAIRGPASNLADIASMIWMREEDPTRIEQMQGLYALAQYLSARADSLAFGADLASHVPPIKSTNIALGDLWQQWCAIFRGLCGYGAKSVEVDISDTTLRHSLTTTRICGDASLLTEILFNIFDNARKACRTTVWVTASCRGPMLSVSIDDDGVGISPGVYDTMWQGHHVDYEIDAPRGFGLGLKWSKRLADALGVSLTVSRQGSKGGAHFEILIPIMGVGECQT